MLPLEVATYRADSICSPAGVVDVQVNVGIGTQAAVETDNITPINQEQAKGWAVNSGEIINDVFNDKAKANTATIYVRVPSTLKSIVEDAAKAKGMSVNSYAIRCLEQAL